MEKVELVIVALACHAHKARQEACFQTWAKDTDNTKAVLMVGHSKFPLPTLDKNNANILHLPCPDDYKSLPLKTSWGCEWAVEHYDFRYIFKCDDDTYVHVPRLLDFSRSQTADYIGLEYADRNYASGGAGYLLSRRAARNLVRRSWHAEGDEDTITANVLRQVGISLTKTERFQIGNSVWPTQHNDKITSHWMTPDQIVQAHRCLQR